MAAASERAVTSVPEERPHIICVDDEEGILHVLRQQLAPFDDDYELDLATSAEEALELIEALEEEREPVAMVIADQIMPGMKGADLLQEVHRRHPLAIKILLTGQAGFDAVVQAINHGGLARFIGKPWDEQDLRLTVRSLLGRYRLAQENLRLLRHLRRTNAELRDFNQTLEHRVEERTAELAAANERLAELAITDGLTGKRNHRFFHERLVLEVARSGRNKLPLSLLMIDIDHFKRFNDRFGHLAGDEALRHVADLIAEGRRINDLVARYGGEEFSVILPDTPREAAAVVAEQTRLRVERAPLQWKEEPLAITISVGVAACPDDAEGAAELIQTADQALYRAKEGGRNRVVVAGTAGDEEPRS